LGNGDGTFQAHREFTADLSRGLSAGDLNNDQYTDLVVARGYGDFVHVLMNDGDWTSPIPSPEFGRRGAEPHALRYSPSAVVSRSHTLQIDSSETPQRKPAALSSSLAAPIRPLIAFTGLDWSELLPELA
jgi:hypothetical protein